MLKVMEMTTYMYADTRFENAISVDIEFRLSPQAEITSDIVATTVSLIDGVQDKRLHQS